MRKAIPATDLVKAARVYGRALRAQHVASENLHEAAVTGRTTKALDHAHDKACCALGIAEHKLLVEAAIVGGWTREDAEGAV